MGFWKKLVYYLVGVMLGVFAVMFVFGDRDIQCSYFPNDRVLYDLRGKEKTIPAEVRREMESSGIDTSDITMMLLTGDVDFQNSQTAQEDTCKTYWIDYESDEARKAFSAHWLNCDSTATLMKVRPLRQE